MGGCDKCGNEKKALRGPRGPKGEKGDPGKQGIQGLKGDKGDPGADGKSSLVLISMLNSDENFDSPSGVPAYLQQIEDNTQEQISGLDLVIPEVGDYVVSAEMVIDASPGGEPNPVGSNKYFNLQLRANGVAVPESIRRFKIFSGTPSNTVSSFKVQAKVTISSANQVVSIHLRNFKLTAEPFLGNIYVFAGSMSAIKMS